MNWFTYIFVFSIVIVITFIIKRVWMALIDSVVALLKKIFFRHQNTKVDKWHTLDEINKKQKMTGD